MTTLMADADRNAIADFEAGRIQFLSLHTASPGIDGSNEAAGGTPPYIRLAVTFTAAGVEGVLGTVKQPATVGVAWSSEVVFDAPAGTYTYWGGWDSEEDGVYRMAHQLEQTETAVAQTEITVSCGIGQVSGA
jgi:hypothetical protein